MVGETDKNVSLKCVYCDKSNDSGVKSKKKCCVWSIYYKKYRNEDWSSKNFYNFIKSYPYYEDYIF